VELVSSDRGKIQVAVKDNGIGFEERFIDQIFKPFHRLHARNEYEGIGMGLAICMKIVQKHGGTLEAKSRPGEGATFLITFKGA
jgi:signal transduction histidine kinase